MITQCSHWLWSSGDERPTIGGSHRLEHLTSSLPSLDPAPSLLFIIGSRHRSITCRRSKRQPERICLDLYDEREFPLLLGTAALNVTSRTNIPCCHPARENHPLACTSQAQAEAAIYSQILYPFVDVFCFCVYSLEELGTTARRVASWIQADQQASRPNCPPHILVMLVGDGWTVRDEETVEDGFGSMVSEYTISLLKTCFPKVSCRRIPETDHFGAVRQILAEHAKAIRRERQAARSLFTVQHFNSLFDRAFKQAGGTLPFSFDCLLAAREDFPVAPSMEIHFENFTKQIVSARQLRDFAAPVIASSIVLDQYPPGMHRTYPNILVVDFPADFLSFRACGGVS